MDEGKQQNEPTAMPENKDTTKECPLCQIAPVLMGVGAAHTSCSLIGDPEKKAKCMAWVDNINPEEIKNAEDLYIGILTHAGIEEADKTAKTFNLGMQNAIIKTVGKKLENGEPVGDKELAAYKQIIKSQGV